MRILITGAAGMIGRKRTVRLVFDRMLNGTSIDKLTQVDITRASGSDSEVSPRIGLVLQADVM